MARLPRFHNWVSTRGIEFGIKMRLIKDKEKSIAFMEEQIDRFQIEKAKIPSHKPLITKVVCLNIIRLMFYYFLPKSTGLPIFIEISWYSFFTA